MRTALQLSPGTQASGATRHRLFLAGLVWVSTLLVVAGLTIAVSSASAVFEQVTEKNTPGFLSVSSENRLPRNAVMGPGDATQWLLKVSLADVQQGDLSVRLHASGHLIDPIGMTAQVHTCSGRFSFPKNNRTEIPFCTGRVVQVLQPTPLRLIATDQKRDIYKLAKLVTGQPREFLVTLQIPATAQQEAVSQEKARIGVEFQASGDDTIGPPATPPESPQNVPPTAKLPLTGVDMLSLGVLAAGLIGLGGTAILRRRLKEGQIQTSVSALSSPVDADGARH